MRSVVAVAVSFLFCASAFAQSSSPVITTVAGSDPTFNEGLPAKSTPLGTISAVAYDRRGALHLVVNNRVVRLLTSGTFVVVAGNGVKDYSGDGGRAQDASLYDPLAIAFDAANNLYIADSYNYVIRKVDTNGIITTFAGTGDPASPTGDGGQAINASLLYPSGLVFDSSGNLYVSEADGHRVRRITPNGVISTVAGTGTQGYSGDNGLATSARLNFPYGLAVDTANNLYIADTGNHVIRRVGPTGVITTVAGNTSETYSGNGGPAKSAGIPYPKSIAVDSRGQLYISDYADHVVRFVNGNGTINIYAGNELDSFDGDGGPASEASLRAPVAITLDSNGLLVIADTESHHVRRVNSNGTIETIAGNGQAAFLGDNGPATSAYVSGPYSILIDRQQNLIIADSGNSRLRKVTPNGTITTLAGDGTFLHLEDENVPATQASLVFPAGLATDAAGNIYFSDGVLQTIRRITPGGSISTIAGSLFGYGSGGDNGPGLKAEFAFPTGLAMDAQGNLFIADTLNHKIRKLNTNTGVVTTVAGTGTQGFSGDGQDAKNAQLFAPFSVAIDPAGRLVIADYGNQRVRRVEASGIINTIVGNPDGADGDNIPAIRAQLIGPFGVTYDRNGNLYIADGDAHQIRKVDTSGIITTLAGRSGVPGFFGDGGPASNALLNQPASPVFDNAGNLYFSDVANGRIRKLLVEKAPYQVSKNSLTLQGTAGSTPVTESVNLSTPIASMRFTATAQGGNWLKVSPSAGFMPTALQITADPQSLAAGTYTGTVTITAPDAAPPVQTISITFNVAAGQSARISLNTTTFSFASIQGGSAATGQLVVTNGGAGSLNFNTAVQTANGGNWLTVSPASGTATGSAPASLTVTATPGNLAAGTYRGTITVSAPGVESVTASVTMTVNAVQQKLLLSQSGLTFRTVEGGGQPLPQNFGILNVGKGTMDWTAQASTFSGGNWLSISQTSGNVARPYLDVSLVDVKIDAGNLQAGSYFGQVQVRAPGADNTPQTVSIILNVLPRGSVLPPEVRPTGLIFTGAPGETPGSQTVMVANMGSDNASYNSSRLTFDGGQWFVHVPTSAAIAPSNPGRITVQANFRNLQQSVLNGVITLQFQDGTVSTVKVLTVVAPQGTEDAKGAARNAGCNPSLLKLQWTNVQQTVNAIVGQPSNLEMQIVDDCGVPLTSSRNNAVVTASFSTGDPAVTMVHTGNGKWGRTWQPKPGLAGQQARISVTALVLGSNLKLISGQLDAMVNIGGGASGPAVAPGGVLNSASYQQNAPVAPGSIITVFGERLADGPETASGNTWRTQLGNAEVKLGDRLLPLYYAGNGQVSAQAPFDLPLDTQLQLVVKRGNAQSVPEPVSVATASPAIYATNSQGTGQGAITNAVTYKVTDSSAPAKAGDILSIYCTGLGAVSPSVAAGVAAPAQEPLARTVNPVTVTIDGKNAQVTYAGLAPGFIGLYQVNAVVPAGVSSGNQVPVTISVVGQTSPAVTIAVQ